MNLPLWLIGSALLLAGCSATRPAPEIPLDNAVPATIEPEIPPPVQIMEIPKVFPLPGQLKPRPEVSASLSTAAVEGKESVAQANSAARMEPFLAGFVNSMQVWSYSPAALYQIYSSPGRVTDIALEPGERLNDVSVSDPVRWIVGDTRSGSGTDERIHLIVKPTRADLKANLVITTDRRAYYAELRSEPDTWMASVSWDYPQDRLRHLQAANIEREASAPLATGILVEQLRFRYEITGDKPSWRPLRAFDDGVKVYIQFPNGIQQGELPPLFIIGSEGETQLVNYRVRPPYYIVDRLFGAAELRLGGKKARTVRITRTDSR